MGSVERVRNSKETRTDMHARFFFLSLSLFSLFFSLFLFLSLSLFLFGLFFCGIDWSLKQDRQRIREAESGREFTTGS